MAAVSMRENNEMKMHASIGERGWAQAVTKGYRKDAISFSSCRTWQRHRSSHARLELDIADTILITRCIILLHFDQAQSSSWLQVHRSLPKEWFRGRSANGPALSQDSLLMRLLPCAWLAVSATVLLMHGRLFYVGEFDEKYLRKLHAVRILRAALRVL